jgi:hypothetical protein
MVNMELNASEIIKKIDSVKNVPGPWNYFQLEFIQCLFDKIDKLETLAQQRPQCGNNK